MRQRLTRHLTPVLRDPSGTKAGPWFGCGGAPSTWRRLELLALSNRHHHPLPVGSLHPKTSVDTLHLRQRGLTSNTGIYLEEGTGEGLCSFSIVFYHCELDARVYPTFRGILIMFGPFPHILFMISCCVTQSNARETTYRLRMTLKRAPVVFS